MSGNAPERMIGKNRRILVIDDNEAIHSDFRKILADEQRQISLSRAAFFNEQPERFNAPVYEVDSAFQGEQGYEMATQAKERGCPYALVFVDVRMPPGWDGVKTLERIWEKQPELQAVLCTAYSDYTWDEMTSKLGQSDRLLILKKPFDVIEVRQLACALTEKWSLARQAHMKFDELERAVSERTETLAEVNRQLEAEIQARREAESHFRLVIEMSPYAVLTVDEQGTIGLINSETEELFGYDRKELNGRSVDLLLPDRYRARHEEHVARFLSGDNPREAPFRQDLLGQRKNGSEVPVQIRLKRVVSDRGTFALCAMMDISERKRMEAKLRHEATHDALTTLPNRTYFLQRLEQAIQRNERRRNSLFAVLFIDLDRFKYINDSLGHLTGDKLLVAAARRIASCLRPEDILARIGGDEFSILLDDLKDEDSPLGVAQRILDAFSKPFEIDREELVTTTSIGITYSSTGYDKPEVLLRDADTAMYEAKSDGKACFRIFDQRMHQQAASMLLLENDLRRAVEEQEFGFRFQPIVSLENGRILAFESLLRWRHPHRGLLLPRDFLHVAENLGLMIPIGAQMFPIAFREVHRWKSVCDHPTPVNINLSPKQLAEKSLMDQIEKAVSVAGIQPSDVCIEITEGAVLENSGLVAHRLSQLQKMGFQLQVDDFGTGFASLSYLYQFPFAALKIDRSFINGGASFGSNWQIVHSIISLAHNLKMKVIAEGIETEEQWSRLQELGCDYGQGHYFSEPLDGDAAMSLLEHSGSLGPETRLVTTNSPV